MIQTHDKVSDVDTHNGHPVASASAGISLDKLSQWVEEDFEEARNTPIRQSADVSLAEELASCEVRLTDELLEPPVCLTITQHGKRFIVGTLGNFSVVTGKAKSRKTFLVSFALAAALRRDNQLGMEGHLPDEKPVVMLFDTEQSQYHVQKLIRRICALYGQQQPPNFKAYFLRPRSTQKRVELIEYALYNTPGVGMVVIDGGRDTVLDILSHEEATTAVGRFMQWTHELNIHLMTVVHENKNDTNVRGAFGSELVNKSEIVIAVTKKGDVSEVAVKDSREEEFSPFAFGIGADGLPYIFDADQQPNVSDETSATTNTRRKSPPDKIPAESVMAILRRAFGQESELRFSQFVTAVSEASEFLGERLGKNRAEEFVTRTVKQGLVYKIKPPKARYEVYTLAQPS